MEQGKKFVPKPGPVDLTKRVTVTATEKHQYRKAGEVFKPGVVAADFLKFKGWAK